MQRKAGHLLLDELSRRPGRSRGTEGSVRVWLDDRRAAPEGWVHVRTPEEAIDLLRAGGIEELSLDHDLGSTSGCASGPATTSCSG
jgi:hypothetical protein